MSWVDKAHKKNQIDKIVEQAMKSPKFKEEMIKAQDKGYRKALDSFLLISVDYLHRNFRCKKDGIIKYVNFFVEQMNYAKEYEDYFENMNEALLEDTGVNVLGSRMEASKKYEKKAEEEVK